MSANATIPVRARFSRAHIVLADQIAEESKGSLSSVVRDALVYYARNEFPRAYKAFLISTGGRRRP